MQELLSRIDTNAKLLSLGTINSLDKSSLSSVRSSIPQILRLIPSLPYASLKNLKDELKRRMDILPSEYSSCGIFLYLIDLIFEKSPMPSLSDIVQHMNLFHINLLDSSVIKDFQSVLSDSSSYDLCKGKSLNNYLLSSDIQQSLNALGNITGEVTNDEVLGYIFSKFCIGK